MIDRKHLDAFTPSACWFLAKVEEAGCAISIYEGRATIARTIKNGTLRSIYVYCGGAIERTKLRRDLPVRLTPEQALKFLEIK